MAPDEVQMKRLPRLPLTVFEHPYARGRQSTWSGSLGEASY